MDEQAGPERKESYHHGDLRKALIAAAEAVLAETGVEGFSLRQVAKRVGVSHSAPAHHFGDAQGLLSALAAEGFRRFLAAMLARQAAASDDPREQMLAQAVGYLNFAEASPALFRLMFGSERVWPSTLELAEAGQAAYRALVEGVARLRGLAPDDPALTPDVLACWSLAHGFAHLVIGRRMVPVEGLSREAREALLRGLVGRVLDGGDRGATAGVL